MSRPRNEWKFFWDLWKPHRLYGLFLVFLTLLATICSVLLPLFFKYLIDTLEIFARQKTTPEIATPLMFLLALGLLRVVTSFYPFFRARMNLILEMGLRNLAFESILKKDYRFFLKFRTGDLVTRLTEDLSGFSKVSWFACSGIFRAFNSSSILIFCAVAMFLLHPVMAFLSLLPLPLALLIFQRLRSSLDDGYEKIQKAISDTGSHIETCVSGIRVLKAYTSEQKEARRFEQILGSRLEKEMQVVKLQNSLNLYYEFINQTAQIVIILCGSYFVVQKQMTIGDFYAFYSYLGMIVYPMLDIPALLVSSRQAFTCVERHKEILEFEAQAPSNAMTDKVQHIELKNVGFDFGSKTALDQLSFEIKKGETLAVVGRIGSGKSTLLSLLSGFLVPSRGQILVNGNPLEGNSMATLRDQIGVISQEPMVLSGTINMNIRFLREIDEAKIQTAAKKSQFAKEIEGFKDGYQQIIGIRGTAVSGGQKQRLTIARALAGQPEFLLLDDVTASLDVENEDRLWTVLNESNATIVVVTHRLATARRADRILCLKEGKISGLGSFEELLANNADFRHILAIQ